MPTRDNKVARFMGHSVFVELTVYYGVYMCTASDYCGRCGASLKLSGRRAKILCRCNNCCLEVYRVPPASKRKQQSCWFQDTTTKKQRERKQASRVDTERPKEHVKSSQGVASAAAIDTVTEHVAVHKSNVSTTSTTPPVASPPCRRYSGQAEAPEDDRQMM